MYSRHVAGVVSYSLNTNKAELLAENVAVLRSAWGGGAMVQQRGRCILVLGVTGYAESGW